MWTVWEKPGKFDEIYHSLVMSQVDPAWSQEYFPSKILKKYWFFVSQCLFLCFLRVDARNSWSRVGGFWPMRFRYVCLLRVPVTCIHTPGVSLCTHALGALNYTRTQHHGVCVGVFRAKCSLFLIFWLLLLLSLLYLIVWFTNYKLVLLISLLS